MYGWNLPTFAIEFYAIYCNYSLTPLVLPMFIGFAFIHNYEPFFWGGLGSTRQAVLWPAGCFYCPLCEMAHLLLNDPPQQGAEKMETIEIFKVSGNLWRNHADESVGMCRRIWFQTYGRYMPSQA